MGYIDGEKHKKILISISSGMIAEMDQLAHDEHRTRSDLVREALRRYLAAAKRDAKVLETVTA